MSTSTVSSNSFGSSHQNFVAHGVLVAGMGVVALTALVVLFGLYNAFAHPLRQYPGPLLWKAFRFPYVVAIHSGDIHLRLKDFHDKYGPIVRIAPNELSYADAAAHQDIYHNRPGHLPFERNRTWFKKMSPDEPHSLMGYDEEAHARQRRAFANSFSDKSLRDQSPAIESYVDLFINQLKERTSGRHWSKQPIDLMQWFVFLMFDISADLSFGESFGSLNAGKPHPWVEIAQDFGKGLSLVASVNLYSPVDKLLRYVIPKHILQRQLDHRAMSAAYAKKRLAMGVNRPDWVSPAKKYDNAKDALSESEWALNMSILIFAGAETTSSALTAIVRYLAQNRGALHRVTEEVRSTFESEIDIKVASVGKLPYLNAVINESLRIAPPAVIAVPRIVPKGGATVCGQWVPGGIYVAYNQFSSNRQNHNFHLPNTFLPERFLDSDSTDNLASSQPFLTGRHTCIGKKLAWAELRLTLARLLYAFDVSLADDGDRWDWGQQNTYILWDKRPLNVILRRRAP
ncbi:benzoate 4-monooxygenase cytochrome P450 [Bimuria novae-zelandiae CBS 107.79]|uniref:Benzoate 4-monooxygenase cytochrome P450 n=1 Tax=Bimuria novae-zelandiae CBS 107.79 TaxID=1447943 RepID=A0A6A5UUP2_9PLEO|nr:benzoate 4-monooxygenase cytochrome P450 [Bimuria novae-zelandiae CBS 107.79]